MSWKGVVPAPASGSMAAHSIDGICDDTNEDLGSRLQPFMFIETAQAFEGQHLTFCFQAPECRSSQKHSKTRSQHPFLIHEDLWRHLLVHQPLDNLRCLQHLCGDEDFVSWSSASLSRASRRERLQAVIGGSYFSWHLPVIASPCLGLRKYNVKQTNEASPNKHQLYWDLRIWKTMKSATQIVPDFDFRKLTSASCVEFWWRHCQVHVSEDSLRLTLISGCFF